MWRRMWIHGIKDVKLIWWSWLQIRWIWLKLIGFMHEVLELSSVYSKSTTIRISLCTYDRQTIRVIFQLHSRFTWRFFRIQMESAQKCGIQDSLSASRFSPRNWETFNVFWIWVRFIVLKFNEKIPEDSNVTIRFIESFTLGLKHVFGWGSYNVFVYPCIGVWHSLLTWCIVLCWSCNFIDSITGSKKTMD